MKEPLEYRQIAGRVAFRLRSLCAPFSTIPLRFRRITMRLLLLTTVTFLLCDATDSVADNQPLQPTPIPANPVLPASPNPPMALFPGNAGSLSRLEEEVELLEAQRETKKAIVKATEIGARAAEVNLDRLQQLASRGATGREEADRAKVEVEAAKAQVEIRVAEMKEIDVRIKYAKKRLEEAKAGPRPFHPVVPANPPKVFDPPKLEPAPKPKDPPKLDEPKKPIADLTKPIAEAPGLVDPTMIDPGMLTQKSIPGGLLILEPNTVDFATLHQFSDLSDYIYRKGMKVVSATKDLEQANAECDVRKDVLEANLDPSKALILKEALIRSEAIVRDAGRVLKIAQAELEKGQQDFESLIAKLKKRE